MPSVLRLLGKSNVHGLLFQYVSSSLRGWHPTHLHLHRSFHLRSWILARLVLIFSIVIRFRCLDTMCRWHCIIIIIID